MDEQRYIARQRIFLAIGDRHSLRILRQLDIGGSQTFSELRDYLQLNPSTLSKKLKLLAALKIIDIDRSRDNLRVFYSLGPYRRTVKRVLSELEKLADEL